jgi:aldehyde:ferredoxin oxidoreductase
MAKILRVNMTDCSITEQDFPEKYKIMGGRTLTSSIIIDEVDPQCHPLGPNNKIIIAPGIVTGTSAPSSGRISVGGKSPLTGGIKEANAGTPWSQIVARLGIKAIIIEGMPKDDKWWGLHITNDKAEFIAVDQYIGLGLYESYKKLYEQYGAKVSIMAIGPGGEMKLSQAGICFNDIDNRPSRYAGRGGLGAVLGSKHLKLIIVDGAGAPGVEIKDKEMFKSGRKKLTDALVAHDVTKAGGVLNAYGTSALINVVNAAGALPTRNFRTGTFEGAEKISGETIAERCSTRGGAGLMGHACHPGCIIKCSNVYPDVDGKELVSVMEYETVWALGANCGIDNLDDIGKLTWICNDLGIDTIEAGVTMGVAMEAGIAEFGDSTRAIELLEEIRQGTPLGRILGNGSALTAKAYGIIRCPAVKSQGMAAYEPRAIKGIGVTYATSPMGADHTSGYTIGAEIVGVGGKVDPLSTENKIELSRKSLKIAGFFDTIGHCVFVGFATADIESGFDGILEECNAVLGTNWTVEDAMKIGADLIAKERGFNKAAGLGSASDRLPEFMKYEPLAPHNEVWNISDEELDTVIPD